MAPNRCFALSALRQGRPSAAETEPRASIRWIHGGAYAELGAWAKWGGRRQEPLVASGEKAATRDPNTAAILFARRLAELRQKRAANQTRAPAAASDVPTSVGAFIRYHLAAKADVKGRRKPSPAEIGLQRTRLLHAAKFLRTRGIRDLRQIDHAAVEVLVALVFAAVAFAYLAWKIPGSVGRPFSSEVRIGLSDGMRSY